MSEPVVLLYDNTSFTGTESKIPLYSFNNLGSPGVTTIKSAKIPTGAYFTVFSNGTNDNMIAGQSKTYTSDVSDITTFSDKITGYIIQTSTIPPSVERHETKYISCTLKDGFMYSGSEIITLNSGQMSTQKINTAVSMSVGTNNVTLIDDNGRPFTFYNNVPYLPAYLTNITTISVVSIPIIAPLPSATVISSATTTTTTTVTPNANTVPPTPSSDKSSSDKKNTIVSFLYKHMFTIIIIIFVAAMIYYGLNYSKINSTVDSKVSTSTAK